MTFSITLLACDISRLLFDCLSVFWRLLFSSVERCSGPILFSSKFDDKGDQIEVFKILNGYENIDSIFLI